jgi:hypothetical protein
MLRVNFRSLSGDSPTLMIASCLRFSADGTLRGPDNSIVASCLDGCWKVGGRMHRELDCEGPVRVRLARRPGLPEAYLGPFTQLRTAGALLYGDGVCLKIGVPGRARSGTTDQEFTLLSDGVRGGQA